MSKYSHTNPPSQKNFDTMNPQELEQLLQGDLLADEPILEEQELMDITRLLSERKPAPALLPAWNAFQEHYLEPPLRLDIPCRQLLWKRLAAIAAALALFLSLPLGSLALVTKGLDGYRASWDTTSFQFQWRKNALPDAAQWSFNGLTVRELQDAGLYPTWIPFGFKPNTYHSSIQLNTETYQNGYIKENATFAIRLSEVDPANPYTWEVDGETVEVYRHEGIKFYLFRHGEQAGACWVKAGLECSIEGDLSEEQIKKMIRSLKNY